MVRATIFLAAPANRERTGGMFVGLKMPRSLSRGSLLATVSKNVRQPFKAKKRHHSTTCGGSV
jgi:hypothetical protein